MFFVFLVVFVSIFANFSRLQRPNARPASSLPAHRVHNARKKFRASFFESDEYYVP